MTVVKIAALANYENWVKTEGNLKCEKPITGIYMEYEYMAKNYKQMFIIK